MKNQRFYTVDEAITLLENYCAYQERCHKDVETKLFQLHLIPEAKEKIILHLIQHNYLNEERFAKAFARGKFSIKNWGKQRIKNELKLRNISNYNINSALKEINEEEYLQTLETLSTKKLQLIKETNLLKKKSKLANYLISKGFETTLVFNHLNTIFT
jgi:regulatory protein